MCWSSYIKGSQIRSADGAETGIALDETSTNRTSSLRVELQGSRRFDQHLLRKKLVLHDTQLKLYSGLSYET